MKTLVKITFIILMTSLVSCTALSPVTKTDLNISDSDKTVELVVYDNRNAGFSENIDSYLPKALSFSEQYLTIDGNPVAEVYFHAPITLKVSKETKTIGVKYESSWFFGLISHWVDYSIPVSLTDQDKYYVKIDSNMLNNNTRVSLVTQKEADEGIEFISRINGHTELKKIN